MSPVLPWRRRCQQGLLSPFRDVGNVVEALYGDLPPPIMLIGHSMGGAIAVHTAVANLVPSLLGLCMIDVVEGECAGLLPPTSSLSPQSLHTEGFAPFLNQFHPPNRSHACKNLCSATPAFPQVYSAFFLLISQNQRLS